LNYDRVFVALGIQHVMCMPHIICGLHGCAIFFHIISQMAPFSENRVIEHKMRVLIVSTFCV